MLFPPSPVIINFVFIVTTPCTFVLLPLPILVSKGYLQIAIDVSIMTSHISTKYDQNTTLTININSLYVFYKRVFWGVGGGDGHKEFNSLPNCVNSNLLSAFGPTYPPLQLVQSFFPGIKSAGA